MENKTVAHVCYECPHNSIIYFTPEQYRRIPEDSDIVCLKCEEHQS